jgi:hypothetical protein
LTRRFLPPNKRCPWPHEPTDQAAAFARCAKAAIFGA